MTLVLDDYAFDTGPDAVTNRCSLFQGHIAEQDDEFLAAPAPKPVKWSA